MAENIKYLSKIINALPHAFDSIYWSMGNTTYKEQMIIVAIEEHKLNKADSIKLLKSCKIFKKYNPIIYWWLDGDIEESMGMFHGVTEKGKKLIDKFHGWA